MITSANRLFGDSLNAVLSGQSASVRFERRSHVTDHVLAGKLAQQKKPLKAENEVQEQLRKITAEGLGAPPLFKSSEPSRPERTGGNPSSEGPERTERSNSSNLIDLFG